MTTQSTPTSTPWQIHGAHGQSILGDYHEAATDPIGVVVIVHGFLGYKDYGMFPRIAEHYAANGFIAHRFNLSHSGMTNNVETFERPDLFEKDTWNNQVMDVGAVMDEIGGGALAGQGLPIVLLGHSRGGVTVLLSAARRFGTDREPLPSGVITLAAPDRCCMHSEEVQNQLLSDGYMEVTSNRTGQVLRVGRDWMAEQCDDPDGHDLIGQVGRIRCSMLIAHGAQDPTVPGACAYDIAKAAGSLAETLVINGGDHVLNTPNPLLAGEPSSGQLAEFLAKGLSFAQGCCAAKTG